MDNREKEPVSGADEADLDTAEVAERAEIFPDAETPSSSTQSDLVETARVHDESVFQEQVLEASKLATYLEWITANTEFSGVDAIPQLTSYFKIKQRSPGIYNFAEAGTLAQEIWSIEEKVRGVKAEGIKPETIKSIREGLFASVLSGKVGAKAILERLNGDIVISENPGDEVGNYQNPENLAAFFEIEGGISNVYLYQRPAEKDSTGQQHHLQHELGHLFAETGAIWEQGVFLDFLDAVSKMDDAKIAEIAEQAPELASIYHLVKNPQEAVFFRPYIQDKLAEISTLQGEAQEGARCTAAKEIIAEMTAFFIGSANSELSYFNARLEMVGGNTMELLRQVLSPERFDTFKEQYDLEGKSLTAEDVLDFIKSAPEFQAEFQAQKAFLTKMQDAFAQRGQNIKPMSETMKIKESMAYADEDFGDYDELYFTQAGGGISGGDHDSISSGGQTSQTGNPFSAVWDFVTGTKGSSPILK